MFVKVVGDFPTNPYKMTFIESVSCNTAASAGGDTPV